MANQKKMLIQFVFINSLVYIAASVYTPYISSYYQMNGMSKLEIGMIMSVGPFVTLFIQPLWGILSDYTGKRKQILQFLCIAAAATMLLYFLGYSVTLMFVCALFYNSTYSAERCCYYTKGQGKSPKLCCYPNGRNDRLCRGYHCGRIFYQRESALHVSIHNYWLSAFDIGCFQCIQGCIHDTKRDACKSRKTIGLENF